MLDKIIAHKRTEIERLDLAELRRRAADAPAPRDFLAGLIPSPIPSPSLEQDAQERGRGARAARGEGVRLIAELKRASPSRGMLAPHLDLIQVAQIYAANGACAISVLTDQEFFLGRLEALYELRITDYFVLPLLRKDFILSPVQLYETRAAGADAVLLILAALPEDPRQSSQSSLLSDLHALALDLGLTPLVEVHNEAELERALSLRDLRLVGINNRDLSTFSVSLETTARLRPRIPPGIRVVSESGIFTRDHVAELAALSVDAVLVGEALVTAPDIGAKVRELAGVCM
jgi:indole-3-glycerol phosphate synthase